MGTLWLYLRNYWRETIIACVIFHFLCKKSIRLIMPGMCLTSTSFDWWHSRTIFIGGLGAWYLFRSLKLPIEQQHFCCYISWYESTPLEFQYCWHDVLVTGVLWRTHWRPWFMLHKNLMLFDFDGWISMQYVHQSIIWENLRESGIWKVIEDFPLRLLYLIDHTSLRHRRL